MPSSQVALDLFLVLLGAIVVIGAVRMCQEVAYHESLLARTRCDDLEMALEVERKDNERLRRAGTRRHPAAVVQVPAYDEEGESCSQGCPLAEICTGYENALCLEAPGFYGMYALTEEEVEDMENG